MSMSVAATLNAVSRRRTVHNFDDDEHGAGGRTYAYGSSDLTTLSQVRSLLEFATNFALKFILKGTHFEEFFSL